MTVEKSWTSSMPPFASLPRSPHIPSCLPIPPPPLPVGSLVLPPHLPVHPPVLLPRGAAVDRPGLRVIILGDIIYMREDIVKMEILLEPTSNKLMKDSILQAGNPVKEILLKLNLPDHRSILADSNVTPTKHGPMIKPYSSPRFIANCFNAGYLKIEVKVPDSSCLKDSQPHAHTQLKNIKTS
nr:hypothetical protein [Tanacetum cinerariifolium]